MQQLRRILLGKRPNYWLKRSSTAGTVSMIMERAMRLTDRVHQCREGELRPREYAGRFCLVAASLFLGACDPRSVRRPEPAANKRSVRIVAFILALTPGLAGCAFDKPRVNETPQALQTNANHVVQCAPGCHLDQSNDFVGDRVPVGGVADGRPPSFPGGSGLIRLPRRAG